MITVRHVEKDDKSFWYTLDRHLPGWEFERKVLYKEGYILLSENEPLGILRYNLFRDNTPFCNLLFIKQAYRGKGYGKQLLGSWEKEMREKGYAAVMTSTQTDETAQRFYRKSGYKDFGCLILDIPAYRQPMEMFMIKEL